MYFFNFFLKSLGAKAWLVHPGRSCGARQTGVRNPQFSEARDFKIHQLPFFRKIIILSDVTNLQSNATSQELFLPSIPILWEGRTLMTVNPDNKMELAAVRVWQKQSTVIKWNQVESRDPQKSHALGLLDGRRIILLFIPCQKIQHAAEGQGKELQVSGSSSHLCLTFKGFLCTQ